ncbi:hypothetical protein PV341_38065 [Streptomyces sp. PA03-1a]|nr:hypothetical protein [Streptomyces sp. PA03-1a]MDX2813375.1 hypothetical protein [Streptomyces sp. PA03-5A]
MTDTAPSVARRSARSLAAERAFRDRLAELGATLLEPQWLGNKAPHRVLCAGGHECLPRPGNAMRVGICRICAGGDSKSAEARFHAWLTELGATLLEPQWLGTHAPHRALCPARHECTYTPAGAKRGRGCQKCARIRMNDAKKARAESAFRQRLAELGATLLEPEWLGSLEMHRIRCQYGHESTPRPADVQQGHGICRACVGLDPATAEAKFRARLAELGATLLEPEWLGNHAPHRVLCTAGHECAPRPSNVARWGVCLRCRGWDSNAFYVVSNSDGALKFGITTGDGRSRLSRHAGAGYETVHRLLTGLPDGIAPRLERDVLATLRLAGERPLHGREYFPDRVRALVLDVVDNYPIGTSGTARKVSA